MGAELAPTTTRVPPDLERICTLPQRPVIDCERERGKRRWSPAAQALIEVETAKVTRGKRLSCACRERHIEAPGNGRLVVFHHAAANGPPPPPLLTTVDAFCRDNIHDPDTVARVSGLRTGQSIVLPGLGYPSCATDLNPVQAWTLRELPRAGGIFGMISVGGGKTWSGILAPLTMPQLRTWAILVKPDQRLHYHKAYLRLREHFLVPSIVFDRADAEGMQHSFSVTGMPVLHVLPYSLLSNPRSTELLKQLDPDGVIADESHLLASKNSTRTMRFLRYMTDRNNRDRSVVFCNWSGSTIKKSLKDAAHLSAHALGLGSPYPIMPEEVEAWATVIDPSILPDRTSQTARKLHKAFGKGEADRAFFVSAFVTDTGVREGHRDRVIRTPGVVSTRSASVNCSITVKRRQAPGLPGTVNEALTTLRTLAKRPDGEELVEAAEITRCAHTLAAGFNYFWHYPEYARAKTDKEKEIIAERIKAWFAARKDWHKELRAKLKHGEAHLDSPLLCANAAERAWRLPRYNGELPVWPAETWPAWAAVKDTIEYEERVNWIDDYLARDAAKWAIENRGIVWCGASAFGRKVAELAGLNYHGGGQDAERRIMAEDGSRSIVASIKAHGTGRDGLQYKFAKQLIADIPPASGDGYEQLLGRTAREGQPEDTVEVELYMHVPENREAFRRAVALAEFIEATTPNQQLLLAADIEFNY